MKEILTFLTLNCDISWTEQTVKLSFLHTVAKSFSESAWYNLQGYRLAEV